MESFTQSAITGLSGGLILGVSVSLMLVLNGRTTGIAGICNGILQYYRGDVAWRVYFILGLLGGGFLLAIQAPEVESPVALVRPLALVSLGGVLVGFGAVMGGGCTAGHGICGLSRFKKRSIVAVVLFIVAGAITSYLLTQAQGSSL